MVYFSPEYLLQHMRFVWKEILVGCLNTKLGYTPHIHHGVKSMRMITIKLKIVKDHTQATTAMPRHNNITSSNYPQLLPHETIMKLECMSDTETGCPGRAIAGRR